MNHLSLAQQNVMNSPTFLNNIPLLIKKDVDIYVINEPPRDFNPSKVGVPYLSISSSRTAIIILNQSMIYEFIQAESNLYVTTVKLPSHKLKLQSVYFPPLGKQNTASRAEPLVYKCFECNSPSTLILGDVNATSSVLGDNDSPRGQKLVSLINSFNWIILNSPNVPTRKEGRYAIDWSVASHDISDNFTWSCSRVDKSISDHCMIYLESTYEQPSEIRNEVRTFINIRSFIRTLQLNEIDVIAQDAPKFLAQAAEASICNAVRKRKQEFFDVACMLSKQKVTQILRRKKKHGSRFPSIELELAEANRIHALNIKKAKENHWSNCIKQCRSVNDIHKLIKANRIQKSSVQQIIHEGAIVSDPAAVASITLPHFFPSTAAPASLLSFIIDGPKDFRITDYEVTMALDAQKSNCPGIDRINLHVITAIQHFIPGLLTAVFNYWFIEEKIPESMKHAVVTLIRKNEQVANSLSNLRPISITNVLARVYERVLIARMNWHLGQAAPNISAQFGFTAGKSTEDALRAIMHARANYFDTKDIVFALDVGGAFNNVSHSAILRECKYRNFSRSITNSMVDYLSGRKVSINLDTSITTTMTRGVPQGTVLGPLLFRLAMDVFIRNMGQLLNLAKIEHSVILFADDCNIVVRASQFCAYPAQMCQWLLTQTNTVLENIGLSLNMSKVQVLSSGTLAPFTIGTVEIPIRPYIKILGVEFQGYGSFPRHIKMKLEEAESVIESLKSYSSSGLVSLQARIALVKSRVHSILTYAADVILTNPLTSELIRRFLFLDRKICSHLFGTPHSMSYISTVTIMSKFSILFALLLSAERKRLKADIAFGLENEVRKFVQHKVHPADRINIKIHRARNSMEIVHPAGLSLALFTDGSKKVNCYATSAAFVTWSPHATVRHEYWYKLPEYATAFQAERHAISKAISFIDECCPSGVYHVLSDSFSTLSAMAHSKPKDPMIVAIQCLVHKCFASDKTIKFTWVKGHANIIGNEEADRACVNALNSYSVMEYVHLPKPVAEVHAYSRAVSKYVAHTSYLFTNTDDSLITSPSVPFDLKLKFDYYTAAFYSNRAPTMMRLKKLGLSNTDLCSCGQQQSTVHLFTSCPLVVNRFSVQFANSQLGNLVGTPLDQVLNSPQLHKFIFKIAKPLLRDLEEVNGFTYNDTKGSTPGRPSANLNTSD